MNAARDEDAIAATGFILLKREPLLYPVAAVKRGEALLRGKVVGSCGVNVGKEKALSQPLKLIFIF